MKFFLVTCMRGHCGRSQYNEISFAISAPNLMNAIAQARKMPGVKHTHNRCVLSGKEISFEEYCARRKESAYKNFSKI